MVFLPVTFLFSWFILKIRGVFHVKHQIIRSDFLESKGVTKLLSDYDEKFKEYADQLLWWNDKVNLVSRGVSRETVLNHVEHSLTISFSQLFQGAAQIIDAGSGGGLPGVPLGVAHPEKEILLNDIVSKKIMACKQIAYKMGLKNVSTKIGSIEAVEMTKDALVVSKHAFKINDLMRFLHDKEWKGVVLLKGNNEIEEELEGVDDPLKINVLSLESFQNSFYDGKALVEITKK
ncbi:MAG: hypothetical protein CL666_16165 [Balneola sp.]|nr:hypothetical protein [Balneola sp.]